MGLFKKKKKPEGEELGPLPEFPKQEFPGFPKLSEEKFPTYEPEIRPRIGPQEREFKPEELIPIRKPTFPKFAPEEPRVFEEPMLLKEEPRVFEEKPIFVKIERYKEAIKTIDQIKEKIEEAEEILKGLNETNTREARELDLWRDDISKIKEKLLSVDKKLFRV